MVDDFRLFTERQLNILIMAPIASGILSIIGSLTIVVDILEDRRRKFKQVYHRLVFMMALMDIICTGGVLALNGWAVPAGSPGNLYAKGNVTTCNAAGFFLMMFQSPALYSAFLSFYYLLLIRYEKSERFIAKRIEPFLHAFALISPLTLGTVALRNGYFNATEVVPGWCWLGHGPGGCEVYDEIECTRGAENIETFNMLLLIASSGLVWMFIITDMTMIVLKVWSQERRLGRYGEANQRTIRTRQTALQAVLYILATILTWVGPVLEALKPVFFGNRDDESYYFAISFTIKFFLPLQGFWNALIYIRPRYREIVDSAKRRFSVIDGSGLGSGRFSSIFFDNSLRSIDIRIRKTSGDTSRSMTRERKKSLIESLNDKLSKDSDDSSIDLEYFGNKLYVVEEEISASSRLDLENGTDMLRKSRHSEDFKTKSKHSSVQSESIDEVLDVSSDEFEEPINFEMVREQFKKVQEQLDDMLQSSHFLGDSEEFPSDTIPRSMNRSNRALAESRRTSVTESQSTSQRISFRSSFSHVISESLTNLFRRPNDDSRSQEYDADDVDKSLEKLDVKEEPRQKAKQEGIQNDSGCFSVDDSKGQGQPSEASIDLDVLEETLAEQRLDDILQQSHFLGSSQMERSYTKGRSRRNLRASQSRMNRSSPAGPYDSQRSSRWKNFMSSTRLYMGDSKDFSQTSFLYGKSKADLGINTEETRQKIPEVGNQNESACFSVAGSKGQGQASEPSLEMKILEDSLAQQYLDEILHESHFLGSSQMEQSHSRVRSRRDSGATHRRLNRSSPAGTYSSQRSGRWKNFMSSSRLYWADSKNFSQRSFLFKSKRNANHDSAHNQEESQELRAAGLQRVVVGDGGNGAAEREERLQGNDNYPSHQDDKVQNTDSVDLKMSFDEQEEPSTSTNDCIIQSSHSEDGMGCPEAPIMTSESGEIIAPETSGIKHQSYPGGVHNVSNGEQTVVSLTCQEQTEDTTGQSDCKKQDCVVAPGLHAQRGQVEYIEEEISCENGEFQSHANVPADQEHCVLKGDQKQNVVDIPEAPILQSVSREEITQESVGNKEPSFAHDPTVPSEEQPINPSTWTKQDDNTKTQKNMARNIHHQEEWGVMTPSLATEYIREGLIEEECSFEDWETQSLDVTENA